MPVLEIYQQSIIGDILTFPFKVLKWIFHLLKSIILLPFKIIKYLLIGIKEVILFLLPEFYGENVFHSFKGLFCAFRILFYILTGLLIVLAPLYGISLLVGYRILGNFDFIHALKIMATVVFTTEAAIIGLSIVGFLVLFALAFLFVTGSSLLEIMGASIKIVNGLTSSRLFLLLTFLVAVMVLVILYLLLLGKIPMPSLFI